jgi:hypothetical protein
VTVPSHIVAQIRERYPQLPDHTNLATHSEVDFVAGIVAALRDLSSDVVPFEHKTRFAMVLGSLERAVQSCANDVRRGHLTGQHIRDVSALLTTFPDEPFRPDDKSLQFIQDEGFRRALSVDIAGAYRAVSHGEWKASTVLAGSVIEALCLWAIQSRSDAQTALDTARRLAAERKLPNNPPSDLLRWHAPELIEVAFALNLIHEDTAEVARTAKTYRNLIHPGRELRTQQRCTEGTSHVAIGAMQRVTEDLAEA